MDFENALSSAADTPETSDIAADTSASSAVRSESLDTPVVDDTGLPAVVRSVFGDYHQRTQTVTETASDGTSVTSTVFVPGLAGLDWYWLSGVFLFTIVLWSFFRFLGVVFKR